MTDCLLTLRQVFFFFFFLEQRGKVYCRVKQGDVWLILKTLNSQMDFREEFCCFFFLREEFLKQILR